MKKVNPFKSQTNRLMFGAIVSLLYPFIVLALEPLFKLSLCQFMFGFMISFGAMSIYHILLMIDPTKRIYILAEAQEEEFNKSFSELKEYLLSRFPRMSQTDLINTVVAHAMFKVDQLGYNSKVKLEDCPRFKQNGFPLDKIEYFTEL